MALVLDRPLFRQRFQEGGAALSFQNLSPEEKQVVARLVMQGVNLEDAIQQVKGVEDSGIGLGEMATAAGAGAGAAALSNAALMKMQEQTGPRRLPAPLDPDAGYAERASRAAKDFDFKDAARSTLSSAKEGLGRFARTPIGTVGKTLARGAFGMPGAVLGTAAMLMGGRDSVEDEMKKEAKDRDLDEFFERDPRNYQEGGPVAPPMAGIGSMQQQADVPPDLVAEMEQSSASEMQKVGSEYVGEVMSSIDAAEEPVEMINAIRGNERPIEERYQELASIVGPEDAAATPETVLTLVQPTLMMTEQGALDSGIGQMVQELTQGAEMISEAGEPTDMGMGMGNLMMQGAEQPAMLPPPQNFAMGGGVMAIPHLRLGSRPESTFGDPGIFFGDTGIFTKLFGQTPKEKRQESAEELVDLQEKISEQREDRPSLVAKFDEDTNRLVDEIRKRPDITISTPGNKVDAMGGLNTGDLVGREFVPRQTFSSSGNVDLGRSYRKLDNAVQMDPASVPEIRGDFSITNPKLDVYKSLSFDPMTDYGKEGALRESLAQRRDLYRDVLGPTESQQGYQKAQTYFDLAEAAANFAAGRDASGRDVRGLSPAAQAAAAFSGVPGRISERLAEERKAQRAIDLAALESAEREESARREATKGERGNIMQALKDQNVTEFLADVRTKEYNSTAAQKSAILNADMQFRALLSDTKYLQQLQLTMTDADIKDELMKTASALEDLNDARSAQRKYQITGELNKQTGKIQSLLQQQKDEYSKAETEATLNLRQSLADDNIRFKGAAISLEGGLNEWRNQLRENENLRSWAESKYNRDFNLEKLIVEEGLTIQAQEAARELAELEAETTLNLGEIDAETEMRKAQLKRELQLTLSDRKYKFLNQKFEQEKLNFAEELGIKKEYLQLKAFETDINGLETLFDLSGGNTGAYRDVGGVKGADLQMVTNPDLLRRYATGKTSERENLELSAAIREFGLPRSFTDAAGNTTTTPGLLPVELRQAMEMRREGGFTVPDYGKEFGIGTLE